MLIYAFRIDMSIQRLKIEIRDKKISEEIDSRVQDHFKSVVDSMEWDEHDEERKRRVLLQFKQTYRDALHENITINGVPWKESEDSKSETKQRNHKQYLNTQLIPEANEALVEVAKQRKTFPFLCAKELAIQCSQECSYEQKLKAKPISDDLSVPVLDVNKEENEEDFKQAMNTCKDLVQTIPSQVEHAKELLTALDIIPSCLH